MRRRLILHFDVNGTIIMTDTAGGKNLDAMINRVIADCAWGQVVKSPTFSWQHYISTDGGLYLITVIHTYVTAICYCHVLLPLYIDIIYIYIWQYYMVVIYGSNIFIAAELWVGMKE